MTNDGNCEEALNCTSACSALCQGKASFSNCPMALGLSSIALQLHRMILEPIRLMFFLNSKGVHSLEFLCLTHPHADHFMGMSCLIRDLQIKAFWAFGAKSAGF